MSFLDRITPLILTFNEEANIARTLDGVSWAKRIVVLDSGSSDATADIVRRYPRAELVVRPFDNHRAQWEFGLEQCGEDSEWILALDADYYVGPALRKELAALSPPDDVSGYRASFDYCIFGRALRGNLYPAVTVLYRRAGAYYGQSGHTQRLVTSGSIATLSSRIDHDDRKPLSHWLASQRKYASLEADHLLSAKRSQLRRSDRIRLMGWPAPLLVFIYALVVKRCLLDGWRGWYYVLQRMLAEIMLALEILDRRAQAAPASPAQATLPDRLRATAQEPR